MALKCSFLHVFCPFSAPNFTTGIGNGPANFRHGSLLWEGLGIRTNTDLGVG